MPKPTDILALLASASRDPAALGTTEDLARRSGWSAAHLHRDFAAVALETPKTWSDRLRVAHAARLLCETDAPVAEIARRAGFASHEVLTRTFRRVLGTTPTALRRTRAALHLRHAPCLSLYHLSLKPRSGPMPVDVTVVTRSPQPVLFMRRRVPHDQIQQALSECLPAVFAYCQQHGIAFAGPPFTRYVDMSRGHFTIEAGIPVASVRPEGDILAGELPGGELALAIHEGPYDTLGDTHSAVEAWVAAQGREAAGPPWESYVTDPGTTPDPKDWRTEVVVPLAS